jgi:hypothetical protein
MIRILLGLGVIFVLVLEGYAIFPGEETPLLNQPQSRSTKLDIKKFPGLVLRKLRRLVTKKPIGLLIEQPLSVLIRSSKRSLY